MRTSSTLALVTIEGGARLGRPSMPVDEELYARGRAALAERTLRWALIAMLVPGADSTAPTSNPSSR